MNNIIGILGGMGPGATVDAFSKIVSHTIAHKDQDHIPVIIANFPGIPDRSEHITGNGPNPLPAMLDALRILENAGASCIIMPCNTAHYWYDELNSRTNATFINIIDVTCEKIVKDKPSSVVLLATTATVSASLYQKKLSLSGITCIEPDENEQIDIMRSIICYKGGDADEALKIIEPYISKMQNSGVKKFIMGCTEIPLILRDMSKRNPDMFVDTTEILVDNALEWYHSRS